MPAFGAIKLVDANVWLALAFSDHAHHGKAKEWFDGQANDTCAFCRVTQLALLRHLTNGKIMGAFVLSQQDAWKNLDQLMSDSRILFLPEPTTVEAAFRGFTQAATPSHAGWTDGYLAAFALGHLARVVTFDRGFSPSTGWTRRSCPSEIIASNITGPWVDLTTVSALPDCAVKHLDSAP